jgi:glutamine amidotransferase-like uncharacterized protein
MRLNDGAVAENLLKGLTAPQSLAEVERMNRRHLLTRMFPVAAIALAQAACSDEQQQKPGPLALVYRGPAALDSCAESAAALLTSSPERFQVKYCGPEEELPLNADTLAMAKLYVQPGGGNNLHKAWKSVRNFGDPLREWLHNGGRFLGICMGAYLAGRDPGWGLLPGDTAEYVGSPGATVNSTADTVVSVRWGGKPRHMYFQDGPYFVLNKGAKGTVLATYSNGVPAAVVTPYGSGHVAVVGPHPEADASWYAEYGLKNPDGVHLDLGYDLVKAAMS